MKSFTASVLAAVMTELVRSEMFDIEKTLTEGFAGLRPEGSDFVMFENERGRPLMHEAVDDGKFLFTFINLYF
jgi:hypothetical protein